MADPVTGPLSRDDLQRLAAAPFGEARKEIQKHDPLWGLRDGEKVDFVVEATGQITGTAYIKAASQEEADKLAGELTSSEVDWGYGNDDFDIVSVQPRVRKW